MADLVEFLRARLDDDQKQRILNATKETA